MEGGNSSKNNKDKSTMKKLPLPPFPPTVGASSESSSQARNNQTNAECRVGRPPKPSPAPSVSASDQLMPVANVVRIMRKVLPPHAKISDEAKFAIQESVTEFISFITEEANQRCKYEQRKTVTAEDLLCSMDTLGFDNYVDPLSRYLEKYRESEGLLHPRRPTMYRPSQAATQPTGGQMARPMTMMPTMPIMNPNNINNPQMMMFTAGGHDNEPGGSSSVRAHAGSQTNNNEGSCSSLMDHLSFEPGSGCVHDALDQLPGDDDASPSGSTSVNFMGPENNDSFDPFAQFK